MKVAVRETRASSFTSQEGGGAAEESRRIDASTPFTFDFPAGPLTLLLMASLCMQVSSIHIIKKSECRSGPWEGSRKTKLDEQHRLRIPPARVCRNRNIGRPM